MYYLFYTGCEPFATWDALRSRETPETWKLSHLGMDHDESLMILRLTGCISLCRCRHVHRIIILRNHTTTSTTICWVPCHLYLFFMSNRADPMFGEPIWSHQSHHVRGLAERCRWKRLSPGSFMQLQGDKFQKWDFALFVAWNCQTGLPWFMHILHQTCLPWFTLW